MASDKPISIVGVGASAGGLDAFEGLFRPMPADTGLAFVLVTHMAQGQRSFRDILRRYTAVPVVDAEDMQQIQPDHIYIGPADHVLTVAEGVIHLQHKPHDQLRHSIDVFLSSLAEACGETCVGIVLSGGGTDGTLGIKAIKEKGGFTLAQGTDGSGPLQSGMPNTAIAAGVVDLVLPVEQMADRLRQFADDLRTSAHERETLEEDENRNRLEICTLLLKQTGHDFSGYKEKTLMRRVRRRMQVLQLVELDRYTEHLKNNPDEVMLLFRDLLIGVTNFFRDPPAFESLASKVIPTLFENKGAADTVRVWVPGCATGEEVYSLAILMREHLDGLKAAPKVQIFATDIDEPALAVARTGRYPTSLLGNVSRERLKRFFISDNGTCSVSKSIRDLCIFSVHNVVRDPPFSRVDLVSCRNLLIYFNTEFQASAIPVFHFALRTRGYLFLGTSENVTNYPDLFAAVDKKYRIFQRRDHVTAPLRLPPLVAQRLTTASAELRPQSGPMAVSVRRTLENRVLDRYAPAHVVVNREGDILHYSARTGKYLEAAPGLPSRQLVAMARRGIKLDVRNALREAIEHHRPAVRENLPVEIEDRVQMVNLTVEPFGEDNGDPLYLVVFTDLGSPASPSDKRQRGSEGDDGVARMEQDLRETRERLQATIEEYETAVEELKSSNEELQSINEEMQSANEELETSKEELQSVNEELQTVNSELNGKIDEVDRANSDLRNVFDSTQIATVFLDRNLVIRTFTPAVSQIFNLISSDRGRPLTDIASHLDAGNLRQDIQSVFETGNIIERRVQQTGGRAHYLMRILPYRTAYNAIDGAIVTFVDVTKLVEAEAQQRRLVEDINQGVLNMLGVVSATATRTLATTAPAEFNEVFLGRLAAMTRGYTLVARGHGGDIRLDDVLGAELAALKDGRKKRVTTKGAPVTVRPDAAIALGLVFYELLANATSHGALSNPKGQVGVTWALERHSAPSLVIRWEEDAGQTITKPKTKGFGTELIERELKGALNGTIKFDYEPRGLKARISIPGDSKRFNALA